MSVEHLHQAVGTVPPGRWAVGVSGGADSVALLLLLHQRQELHLHVAHLDHQTRGQQSTDDAAFVAALAERLDLPCTIATRSDIERDLAAPDNNREARYRAARHALFQQVVTRNELAGVLLAHHADDQAETLLLRLLRGSGRPRGMRPSTQINGLQLLRPLLSIRRRDLRQYLDDHNQPWREDASNQSDEITRNRARRLLESDEHLSADLLQLARTMDALHQWVEAQAPKLEAEFPIRQLQDVPDLLAEASARQWLRSRGAPPDDLTSEVLQRLLQMARDAATPARQHFPGNVHVHRRAGHIA